VRADPEQRCKKAVVIALRISREVLCKVLVHLEHAHLVLAPEHRLKLFVGHNLPLVLRVLEPVCLNVLPDFLMYSQILLTTSERGKGAEPTMAASSCDGWSGLRKAEVFSWAAPSVAFASVCGFSGFDGGM
jgi:hypothetical protein